MFVAYFCFVFFFKNFKSASNGFLVLWLKSGEKVSPEEDAKGSHRTVNTHKLLKHIHTPDLPSTLKGPIAVILGALRAQCGPAQDACLTTETGRQLCEELSWKK